MKANELMIGDWVQVTDACTEKSIPCKITRIWENEYVALDGDIDATDLPTNLLAPIPITPEILKENGFINGEFYAESLIEDWQIMSDCIHLAARSERGWCIDIPCRYVHELQRVLRCVGLFELANNFKI